MEGDHLGYRFEIIRELDKGAFGQVLKCYDHKDKCEVAVKINRNTPFDHNNSRVEIGILKKLRNGISDEEKHTSLHNYRERVVEMKESFYFRNHYVNCKY